MDSPPLSRRIRSEISPSERLLNQVRQTISGLAGLCFLCVLGIQFLWSPRPGRTGWPEALLVLLTVLATLGALSRSLPVQKILFATIVTGLLGGLAHGLGATTAFPFGPFIYSEAIGPQYFQTLAWPLPLLWIIVILNSRGVAKLILRPWRKLRNYGYWLIGLTAMLVAVFDLALEPFATRGNHYWLWLPTKFPYTWYGAPLVNFLGWLLTTLLILAFTTPALTQKPARTRKNRTDYHPLIVWLLACLLFATSAAQNQLWVAVGLDVFSGIAIAILALRGACW